MERAGGVRHVPCGVADCYVSSPDERRGKVYRSIMSSNDNPGGTENNNPPGLGFWELVREDYRTHGSDWTTPGFRVMFVHRFGNARMSVRPRVARVPLSVLYRYMFRKVRNKYGIEIDYSTKLGRRFAIDHQNGIVISGYCELGDECRIRQNVTMGIRAAGETGAPKLGRGVDVGAGAVLLGPITVGDGAIIGANAVVLQDVPAGALAVGIPARIVVRAPVSAVSDETTVADGSTVADELAAVIERVAAPESSVATESAAATLIVESSQRA
jgi:serine O-acetyltransferase